MMKQMRLPWRKMMMSRNTTIRTVFYVMCPVLLLIWGIVATAQDKTPEVQHISLEEVKSKAAGAAVNKVGQLEINAAKYHRQAAQADYFPKLNADFLNLHYNKFLGQTIQLFHREAAVPLFGKDWTAVALTFTQPVTQLLQVRQAVTVARADEQIAQAKVGQLAAQTSENVERLYFELLIANRRQTIAQKKVEALQITQQLASTVAMQTRNDVDHD